MTERLLILGDRRSLADALVHQVGAGGGSAEAVLAGSDAELTRRLSEDGWTAVAVLTHDDALALRLSLLSAHVRPDLELWATFFDRSILHRFSEIVSFVHVVATADLVADALARRCCGHADCSGAGLRAGLRIVDDALTLMLRAGAGLIGVLTLQTLLTVIALHDGVVNALYFSTRSVATVADVPNSTHAASWFKLVSTATTITSVVLVAIFTAALVKRLGRPRLTTIFGPRRAPAHGHAILIGFGQIGFRLAQALQKRGVPVLALERSFDAPCVRLAAEAGIPLTIGRGDDRATLELLGVRRAAVVAAVTSDDLTNVAIGLAASDVRPGVPLVLRLGDGNVAAETESLLHLGEIVDANQLVAEHISAALFAPRVRDPEHLWRSI
ncbi:NAD-binding protein [Conexibacter sp. DBS9H8]|uniref:NAD-binding protein n=1 Tax=Conexibacter sp. DBS9H8 TaxID=2937801 RepID=UPI00200CA5FA|nr:NAD-binding protein [Conexibacter sp. DBS9H8]